MATDAEIRDRIESCEWHGCAPGFETARIARDAPSDDWYDWVVG